MSCLGNKEVMANNIKKYMKKKNVNASDVCDTLGIKHNTFSDWVNAKTYPRIDKIELMANYFDCQKSDLVEDKYDLLTSVINEDDGKLLAMYRKLNARDREIINSMIMSMLNSYQ